MSYFDDASLVLIPSGYKASKVYSVKPTDGTGDLTFTRSLDTATRVGADGLIEKVRTNVVLQSQTFDNAGWTKNAGATITANTTIAPDGTLTAETLDVATTTFSGLVQTFTTTTNTWTVSLFVKKGTKDFLYIFDPTTTGNAYFNLTTGAVASTFSTTATMTSVGNGWFRCSVTRSITGGSHSFQFGLSDADASFTPASTGTAFIWGAQAETSDFGATPYIPTTTAAVSVGMLANVPRLDYLGGGCPKLLLEPQRTNLVTFSEQLNNAAYTKSQTSVSANAIASPDGTTSADFIIPSVTNGLHSVLLGGASVSSGTHTLSVFAKKGLYKNLLVWFDGHSGGVGVNLDTLAVFRDTNNSGYKIENYGNGWVRISVTCAVSVASPPNFYIYDNSATPVISWAGNGTDGLYMWGCSLELGSYATSYIPTLGAAVTRSADSGTTNIVSLINASEGVLFLDYKVLNVVDSFPVDFQLQFSGSNSVNGVTIFHSGNIPSISVRSNSVLVFSQALPAVSVGSQNKIAVAFKASDFAVYLNGVQIATQASGAAPLALNEIRLSDGSRNFAINQTLIFKTRLTNAQLAELTA